jgi:integrase
VLAECPDWLRPIVGLAAFTAMRRGEILGLRSINVDMIGHRLMLSQTKNGEGRIVHLNQLAAQVIESQWRKDAKTTDRVFPLADEWTADNVSKGFAAVCRRLQLKDVSFHTLRQRPRVGFAYKAPTSTRSRSCSATKICGWRCVTSTSVLSF